ncbi:MAG: hypothetical protein D6753_00675 [Planctomycetota bacterium]|nr:MAG: hypothetical protein D6753_00675 [Planctomycetota bacterium]
MKNIRTHGLLLLVLCQLYLSFLRAELSAAAPIRREGESGRCKRHTVVFSASAAMLNRKWKGWGPVVFRSRRTPILLAGYRQYLDDGDLRRFVDHVAQHYRPGTLERLLTTGDTLVRRAAAFGLGIVGEPSSLHVLGPALASADRQLRLLADDAFWAICQREGNPDTIHRLRWIQRCNDAGRFQQAEAMASATIASSAATAECYYQRAVSRSHQGRFYAAQSDCRDALSRNRYHYRAMVLLANCALQVNDPLDALYWLRCALDVHPDQERTRVLARRLQRAALER